MRRRGLPARFSSGCRRSAVEVAGARSRHAPARCAWRRLRRMPSPDEELRIAMAAHKAERFEEAEAGLSARARSAARSPQGALLPGAAAVPSRRYGYGHQVRTALPEPRAHERAGVEHAGRPVSSPQAARPKRGTPIGTRRSCARDGGGLVQLRHLPARRRRCRRRHRRATHEPGPRARLFALLRSPRHRALSGRAHRRKPRTSIATGPPASRKARKHGTWSPRFPNAMSPHAPPTTTCASSSTAPRGSFDANLGKLNYRAPELVVECARCAPAQASAASVARG